ncbi:hypothetical protein MXB_4974 [Myxobolus squamalis]|nr:hypothetical protein MXB_4974 [Myxobolus squamalis]
MINDALGHKTDETNLKYRNTGTMLAMIPLGLTKNLQLLDISEKGIVDVFKRIMKSASIKHASY